MSAAVSSSVIRLTLPDGSVREVPSGTTGRAVAESIGPRLAKDALGVKLDGAVLDLSRPLMASGKFEVVTPKHPDALELYRHSTAHLCANAVKRLFPGVKIGIGPAIENGFYYDFDPGRPFTPEDLEKIEAEMKRIVAEDNAVVRKEMSKAEAVKLFEGQNDPLKVEIVDGIPEGSLSCYEQKDFIDLCRGPHVPSTGKLGVFKLTHAAGAYWKGDERNPMLQRIYGAVFLTQKELDEHLAAPRGGEGARPPQGRQGARALRVPSLGARVAVLPPEGRDGLQPPRRVHARAVRQVRLPGGRDAADLRRRALQDVGPLPELPRQHVLHDDRRARVRREAHELPRATSSCTARRRSRTATSRSATRTSGASTATRSPGVTQGLTRVRTFAQDDSHIFCTIDQMAAEMNLFLDFIREVYETFALPRGQGRPRDAAREVHGGDRELGQGREGPVGRVREARRVAARVVVLRERRRRRLLRAEARLPGHGRDRPRLAARHAPGRLLEPRAVRPPLHGRGRVEEAPRRPPPGDPRLPRALLRDPHRAHGRRLPVLARAGAGPGGSCLGEIQ